jgi:sn-glycerol 3-phosphate transport system substrate-binding protein
VPVHHELAGLDAARELLAWHNVEFATKGNGLRGMDTRLAFNTPLHVRHIENLANMAKQGCSSTRAAATRPTRPSYPGECAMYTGSSALYGSVKRNAKFAFGHLTLPYYPDVPGAPQNTVIGGASLWVMSGKKAEEYKGVAAVLRLPVEAEVAGQEPPAHRLPADHHGLLRADREERLLQEEPGHRRRVTQMIRKTTDKSRGIRLGNFVQIRTIIDEEIEQVWAGKKTAKEGLDAA